MDTTDDKILRKIHKPDPVPARHRLSQGGRWKIWPELPARAETGDSGPHDQQILLVDLCQESL